MGLCFCPWLVFPSQNYFKEEVLTNLVENTKSLYVLLTLFDYLFTTTTFDLWMSMGAHEVFALVVNFINADWQPKQVTIGFFEVIEITGQTMAVKLQAFLDKYNIWKKIITYVKDEGSKLGTMTTTLTWHNR
jgi:uncharacterized protein YktA (UPF0223 family)